MAVARMKWYGWWLRFQACQSLGRCDSRRMILAEDLAPTGETFAE